jgi:hypothetical protein
MAHFAELDDRNNVVRVLVVNNADTLDKHGNESEAVGAALLASLVGGRWIQCSYNARIRGAYPGIGWTYDPAADTFMAPPEPEPDPDEPA